MKGPLGSELGCPSSVNSLNSLHSVVGGVSGDSDDMGSERSIGSPSERSSVGSPG